MPQDGEEVVDLIESLDEPLHLRPLHDALEKNTADAVSRSVIIQSRSVAARADAYRLA